MSLQICENSFLSPGQNKSSIKNTDMMVVTTKQFLPRSANGLKDFCTVGENHGAVINSRSVNTQLSLLFTSMHNFIRSFSTILICISLN